LINLFHYDTFSVKNFIRLMPHLAVAEINRYRDIAERHKTDDGRDYGAALSEISKLLDKKIALSELDDGNINRTPATFAVAVFCYKYRPESPRFRDVINLYYLW